jgi:hypothetical protein
VPTDNYTLDGTCNNFFPAGAATAGAVNQTLARLTTNSYSDGLRKIDSKLTNADFIAKNKFPTPIKRNKGAQNMFAIGLFEFGMEDLVDVAQNTSNPVTYGSGNKWKIFRCRESKSIASQTANYGNAETGWIDASNLYGVTQSDLNARKTGFKLNEAALMTIWQGEGRSREYITVGQLLVRYHNKFAKLLEVYFCWVDPGYPAAPFVDTACSAGNTTNIFIVSRFATIHWLQALIEVELFPSFFYNQNDPNTPFGSTNFPTTKQILTQKAQVVADLTFDPPPGYPTTTFPTGTRFLPSDLSWWLSVATDTSTDNDTVNHPAAPYNSVNNQYCTTNNYAPYAGDKQFINTLYNLFNQPANGWGSGIGSQNLNALIDAIQRARDLGLGNYGDYIAALDTVTSVNAGNELFLGAHLETLGYPPITDRTGWSYSSDYAQVVLALTAYQLHNAIAEDRLSILGSANTPNVVQEFLDTSLTFCSGGCPFDAQKAYEILTGINTPSTLYQGQYFGDINDPNILQRVKSSLAVALFYDYEIQGNQVIYHYDEFADASLSGFAGDCIPPILTSTVTEFTGVACGCCNDASGFPPQC